MEDGKTAEANWLLQEGKATERTFASFESTPVWQDARLLVREIYELTKKPFFIQDRSFCDQLRRAAISVMNNVAEGYERGTEPELIRFLYIAKGSCGEVRSMLHAANDLKLVSPEESEGLRQQCLGISRQ